MNEGFKMNHTLLDELTIPVLMSFEVMYTGVKFVLSSTLLFVIDPQLMDPLTNTISFESLSYNVPVYLITLIS